MQTSTAVVLAVPVQISEQARLQPHSTALHCGDEDLSFGEFDRRADQFADYLRRRARVSGGTVAICLERSPEWIIAALGTMRAGAAYVPLDSAWPEARLRFAINDSGAIAIVARRSTLERLQVQVLGIDPYVDAEAIASAAGSSECSISLNSLAYLIYTSGSTGMPKGVEITHANLVHLTKWHRDAFGVTPRDRVSHLAGLGFDAAAWEIWPNLCAGATVCLAGDEVRSSPDLIQGWMLQDRITIGFVPTVHASSMIAMKWPDSTPLRLLLTGGDTLHRGPLKKLPFDVVNNYGPTECSVVATSSTLQPEHLGIPPIGRPIAGTTVYLLDEARGQVPDGSVGEIYIGGAGVGRGYRNLPELTAQNFLPDPFAGNSPARIYRTGDRGIRCADGEIQFLGRTDRQVKIRGQRVELDEIGSVLSQHPALNYAVVIGHGAANEEKRLLAFVLQRENAFNVGATDLQAHLAQKLPDYMIPAIFVRLQYVPLSASGKADLSLLPKPSDENLLATVATSRLLTPLEEKLHSMMQRLLNSNALELNDNFFLAGGDSLLGMQLIILLRDEFGLELTFDQIFEAASVEELAVLIEKMRKKEGRNRVRGRMPGNKNAAVKGGDHKPVACNPRRHTQSVEGDGSMLSARVFSLQKFGPHKMTFWVHYLNLSLHKALGPDQQVSFLALTPEDLELLGQTPSLKSIAAQLVRKILVAQPGGPYTIGGFCIGGVLAYEIAFQLRSSGHEVALLMLLDSPAPSFLTLRHPLGPRLTEPRYLIRRIAKVGLSMALLKSRNRLFERLGLLDSPISGKKASPAQKMIEAAASAYSPESYGGEVLLLLASDRAPHVNFLPEWQTLVTGDLHVRFVSGHHSDLMKPPYVQNIAAMIASHLGSSVQTERTVSTPNTRLFSASGDD
jgi:amino acid adenylation domain-containing protein